MTNSMTDNEFQYVTRLFQSMLKGEKMIDRDRSFLMNTYDDMNEAEQTGSVAQIIKIMLEEGLQ